MTPRAQFSMYISKKGTLPFQRKMDSWPECTKIRYLHLWCIRHRAPVNDPSLDVCMAMCHPSPMNLLMSWFATCDEVSLASHTPPMPSPLHRTWLGTREFAWVSGPVGGVAGTTTL